MIDENDRKVKAKLRKLEILLTIGGISYEEDKKSYRDRESNIIVSTLGRLW